MNPNFAISKGITLAVPTLFFAILMALPANAELPGRKGGGPGRKPGPIIVAPGAGETTETGSEAAEWTAPDSMILDRRGDGIDLSGSTVTDLVTGESMKLHWIGKDSDDVFLVMDTTSLRKVGYDVRTSSGQEIKGKILVRGGVLIKTSFGAELQSSDGWHTLAILDTNEDEKLSAADKTWNHLRVFTDGKKDGQMEGRELLSLSDGGVKEIELKGEGEDREGVTDENGNTLVKGIFIRNDGKRGMAFAVILSPVEAETVESGGAVSSPKTPKPQPLKTPSPAPSKGGKGGGRR